MSDYYYPHPLAKTESILSRTNPRKRKRNEAEDDVDSVSSLESTKQQSSQSTWADFVSSDVIQRKTAGLGPEEDIPGNQFPNRPEDYKRYLERSTAPSQLVKELASLKPPLIEHAQHGSLLLLSRPGLKQQHISALYALLHRCLLDKDYIRAGRAFGLLLRTESLGKPADLRDKNIWGIGAEILLCRKGQEGVVNAYQKGIEDAKQYFESLIIQFPYRTKAPEAVSAVQFYPVLYGLLIAALDDKYRTATQSVGDPGEPGEGYSIRQIDEINSIRRSILVDAQELVSRIDEVMRSIPYSDDRALWKLKGNLYLWISDLSRPHNEAPEDSSMGGSDEEQDLNYSIARSNAKAAFTMATSHENVRKIQSGDFYDSDDT